MIASMGLIAGCLIIYCVALWATLEAVHTIIGWREQVKWDRCGRYISNELSSMARWCAHEYPIIDDVAAEIISNLNNGGCICDNSSFRDKLRKKYPINKEATNDQAKE